MASVTKSKIERGYKLSFSPVTKTIYLLRAWEDLGGGNLRAVNKIDITSEFGAMQALLEEEGIELAAVEPEAGEIGV